MSVALRLTCVSLLVVSACQSTPEARPDEARQQAAVHADEQRPLKLTGANVTEQSLLKATLLVTGQVRGDVTERSLHWEANAGDKVLGEGEVTIQPSANGDFSAPLVLTFGKSLEDLAPYQSEKSFEVVVTTTLGDFTASRSRSVRSPLLPVVSVATVRASRSGSRAVALTYLVMVHNPNPFEVRAGNLSYTAYLADKTVGKDEFPLGSTLPASAQSEFEVAAEFNNENSDGTFNALLREDELEWRFSGSIDARSLQIPFELDGTLHLSKN